MLQELVSRILPQELHRLVVSAALHEHVSDLEREPESCLVMLLVLGQGLHAQSADERFHQEEVLGHFFLQLWELFEVPEHIKTCLHKVWKREIPEDIWHLPHQSVSSRVLFLAPASIHKLSHLLPDIGVLDQRYDALLNQVVQRAA